MNATTRRILTMLSICAAQAAWSAGAEEPSTPQDRLATARTELQAKRWNAAIAELRRVDDTRSADWNNLMGYALRKQATPDLDGAERHYNAALRIDPKHLGALEYSGELYLMKGELPRAEQRLQTLQTACANCEEYQDLKTAVERFKANGNRYTAKP